MKNSADKQVLKKQNSGKRANVKQVPKKNQILNDPEKLSPEQQAHETHGSKKRVPKEKDLRNQAFNKASASSVKFDRVVVLSPLQRSPEASSSLINVPLVPECRSEISLHDIYILINSLKDSKR